MLLEIELSTGYMRLQNGCDMLMNELILWQGITKEDIEKCTPRFMAFAAAMRDTGKLNLDNHNPMIIESKLSHINLIK